MRIDEPDIVAGIPNVVSYLFCWSCCCCFLLTVFDLFRVWLIYYSWLSWRVADLLGVGLACWLLLFAGLECLEFQ